MSRNNWLDAVRGWAMLLVLACHNPYTAQYTKDIMWPCVAVFFLISGYTYREGVSWDKYLKSKARRILVPYLVYGLVLSVLANLYVRGMSLNMEGFIKSIFGLLYGRASVFAPNSEFNIQLWDSACGPLWYLSCMFITCIFMKILTDRHGINRFVVFMIYLVAGILSVHLRIMLPWNVDVAFMSTILMYVGYLCGQTDWSKEPKWVLAICGAVTALICFGLVVYNGPGNMTIALRIYGIHGAKSFIIFALIASLAFIYKNYACMIFEGTMLSKALEHVGNNTLVILCTHYFVYIKVVGFMDHFGMPVSGAFIVIRWFVTMAAVIIAADVLRAIFSKLGWKYLY